MNIIKSKCKTNYSHPLFPNLKLIYSDPIDIVKSASFWLFNSQDPIINSLFNHTCKNDYPDYPASECMKFFCAVNVYASGTVAACKLVKVSL